MQDNSELNVKDLGNSLKNFYSYFLKKWKLLFLAGIIGGALGLTYALLKKPVYEAGMSFMINEAEKGGIGSLAMLAGQLGIGGGMANISDEKVLFLLQSDQILGNALLKEIESNGKKDLLVNFYITEFNTTKRWKNDTILENFNHFTNRSLNALTYEEHKALRSIMKEIIDSKDFQAQSTKRATLVGNTQGGIITIAYKSNSENIAKNLIEHVTNELSEFYISRSIQRQQNNYRTIENRADSIKSLISEKEITLARTKDENMRMIRAQGRLSELRLSKEIEMLYAMFAEVVKNMEIAKFNLEISTPIFQIIDKPYFPLKMEKTSKLISIIIGGFITGFLFVSYHVLKRFF